MIPSDGDYHKIALITFDNNATLKSTFTNNKDTLLNQIDSLKTGGGTNYANAYQAVINLLSSYSQNSNRDLVMLFLTDGEGTSAKAQYTTLKEKYKISIQAIQYDMGKDIKHKIKDISDKQHVAEATNLKGILFEAVGEATDKIQVEELMKAESYEKFEVIDEIGEYFHVKSVDDLKVSIGSVRLEKDKDGIEKVIWTITKEDDLKPGTLVYATEAYGTLEHPYEVIEE